MTFRRHICSSISRLVLSLLLFFSGAEAEAQKFLKLEKDTIPIFRGFAVSFDLAGALQMTLSDHGQYEGALRLNLHDQYFPILEVGLGHANHEEDPNTGLSYKTTAPYFRLGADFNIMNNKHTGNRVFVGFRYAFSSYSVDIAHPVYEDPVWKWDTSLDLSGQSCRMHWGEVVFGLEGKVWGPLHVGWSGRYRIRFSHRDGSMGKTWYVPGYGMQDSSALGYTFYVALDI